MKYIFLDESGDLGFKDKSSKFFVITLMCCDVHTEIEISRIIKKIRRKILKKKMKNTSELKGNNSSDKIRNAVLEKASKKNIEIYTIILDKSKVYNYLRDYKDKLYNYTANLILNECSFDNNKISLVVDKRGGVLAADFNRYIKFKLINKNNCDIKVEHKNSNKDGCLQVLDFISWAIFRKYESKDEEFYNIIRSKITTEKHMFNMDPRG
ncbi:MAG: DUF3800 domain-containing protein [Nanoarchaeota archaeon]